MDVFESLDIEAVVIGRLSDRVDVPVSGDVPAQRPESFVTVERTGGAREDVVIDRPRLAIQCWAATRDAAKNLAYAVDALIPTLTEIPAVSEASRNSLYNFPDPDSRSGRYQIVVDLTTTY